MKSSILSLGCLLVFASCSTDAYFDGRGRLIPAEEFSKSLKEGKGQDFSIFRVSDERKHAANELEQANLRQVDSPTESVQRASSADARAAFGGEEQAQLSEARDARYLSQGLHLQRSIEGPKTNFVSDGDVAGDQPKEFYRQPPRPPQLPPGSRSPYATGQMTGNPSLFPDEGQGANLFTDFRAFQPMDVITITVNEDSKGKKTTKTNTEGKFSLLAGIANLFGIESKDWESNNAGLDSENLIQATTDSKFEGKGEMKREGNLKAQISAVIMEVLPNGLMRVEGTKIVAVDEEEEVMVISGLVRARDINSQNQVDSNRIANMRIDFYGRGVLGDHQSPGWGARLFSKIWPF